VACHTGSVSDRLWSDVDDYLVEVLGIGDPVVRDALRRSVEAGLPPINVAPHQGRMLELLARGWGARRILEIGTLGGYSTIWLARALAGDGVLVSLELDARHAEVARRNIDQAGFAALAQVRVGLALDSLRSLVDEHAAPFDLIFIDADKESYPEYFEWSLQLARPGTLVIADNVIRDGAILDPENTDARVAGVRRFLERVGREPRVSATAVQTVGGKGYDGFALIYVRE